MTTKMVRVRAVYVPCVCVVLCLAVATAAALRPGGGSVYSGSSKLSREQLCDLMCGSDFCPPSCEQSLFHMGKRQVRPFQDLHSLSFDDYIFLKLMGRTRK